MEEGNNRNDSRRKVHVLSEEGKKPKEIAQELGLSKQAVSYHLKQLSLERHRKPNKTKRRRRKIEWSIYHESRVARGECLLDLDMLAEESKALAEMNEGKIGRRFGYSDFLMEFSFSLKVAFKINYPMLEGVLRKVLPLLGLKSPDYSTICKRVEKLPVGLLTFSENKEASEDAIDSTGRSQNLRGSYRESKYDIAARKFLKLSVEVDTESLEVKAFTLQEPNTADIKESPGLLKQAIPTCRDKPKKVYQDRGYDSAEHRANLLAEGIEPVIRPRIYGGLEENEAMLRHLVKEFQNCLSQAERKRLLGQIHRLKAVVGCIRDYEKWRDQNEYGKRAMAENFFSRDTLIFGDRVSSKEIRRGKVEMAIRVTLLNAFITLRRCASKPEMSSVKDYIIQRLRLRVHKPAA